MAGGGTLSPREPYFVAGGSVRILTRKSTVEAGRQAVGNLPRDIRVLQLRQGGGQKVSFCSLLGTVDIPAVANGYAGSPIRTDAVLNTAHAIFIKISAPGL
jgi:hypothetical protein